MYSKFVRWLDHAFSEGIPSDVVALNFNIYESGTDLWSVEVIGSSFYDKENSDWACDKMTDFGTENFPFTWREKAGWKQVKKKVCGFLKKYMKEGRYSGALKTKKAVCAGFTDGDLVVIYSKKERQAIPKQKMILIGLYSFGIILAIVLYLAEILNGKSPTENLLKFFIILATFVLGLVKTIVSSPKRKVSIEGAYAKQIGDAFDDDKRDKKLLIDAIKDFNEDRCSVALKKLKTLSDNASSSQEKQVVHLFSALCYEDLKENQKAIEEYKIVLGLNPANSTALNNISRLFSEDGQYDMAIIIGEKAVKADPRNYYAYNNIANAYLKLYDTEKAKKYALSALDFKPGFRQAASLLAILYTAENDTQNAKSYINIAVAAGETEDRIKNAAVIYGEQLNKIREMKAKINKWIKLTEIPAISISLEGGCGKSIIGGSINEPPPKNNEGEDMRLLAAIYFSELPKNDIFPDRGVLRFYITPDDYYGAALDDYEDGLNRQKGFRVLFDEDESKFTTEETAEDLELFPVFGCFRPAFSKINNPLPTEDYRFGATYERLISEHEDLVMTDDEIDELVSAVNSDGHKMGGYPYFTQEDPRDAQNIYQKYDTLLLQLTSETVDDGKELMFGDSGVCNFFIPYDKLKKCDFSDVLYHWDCY